MTELAPTFTTDWNMTTLKRVGRVFGSAVGGLATRWRHRREIRQLSGFDDRMLKDIGLTRSEVDGALAELFFQDRAVYLLRWSERKSRQEMVVSSTRPRPTVPFLSSKGQRA